MHLSISQGLQWPVQTCQYTISIYKHDSQDCKEISLTVWDTGFSWKNMGPIEGTPLNPSTRYSALTVQRVSGSVDKLKRHSCWETPVPRTAARLVGVFFPCWEHDRYPICKFAVSIIGNRKWHIYIGEGSIEFIELWCQSQTGKRGPLLTLQDDSAAMVLAISRVVPIPLHVFFLVWLSSLENYNVTPRLGTLQLKDPLNPL